MRLTVEPGARKITGLSDARESLLMFLVSHVCGHVLAITYFYVPLSEEPYLYDEQENTRRVHECPTGM